jgi:CMP-N,N'-diacetyllegionaminic acid synthase
MRTALITARGGSKGLPRKNILPIMGTPLIAWTIKAALESECIDNVYVSTEDDEIKSVSIALGAQVISRPVELAQDNSGSESVIAHALEFLKLNDIVTTEVFLLQPTSPTRTSQHINEAYDLYVKESANCVISVFEPEHSPAKAYKLNDDGSIEGLLFIGAPYSRRQDLPRSFQPNGAIYIFSTDVFMLDKLIPRTKVYPYIMNKNASIDIDTLDDLIEAESYLKRMNND